jgi:ribosomal protein S18 acetylase RimI-like enzyme
MTTYTVRGATAGDVKAVAAIHAAVGDTDNRLSFWRDAIEYAEPQVFVVQDGSTVIGFVGFDRSRDPGSKNTVGEIWAIYVLPSHWGKGAGLMLWDAAREGLVEEGCTSVTVWLPLLNERALRFHELAGFKRELSTARTKQKGASRIEEIRLQRSTG